jgi:hypothetical protein
VYRLLEVKDDGYLINHCGHKRTVPHDMVSSITFPEQLVSQVEHYEIIEKAQESNNKRRKSEEQLRVTKDQLHQEVR